MVIQVFSNAKLDAIPRSHVRGSPRECFKIFAATAVAAGIPNDVRDIVCKTAYPSINSFLQDCTSLCPKPGAQDRHAMPHPFQSNNHRPQPFHYSNNHFTPP